MAAALTICDPHFHVWDSVTVENPNLGDIRDKYVVYLMKDFVAGGGASLKIESAVHVETVVGQAEGGFKLDTVAETKFVVEQSKDFPGPLAIVPFVNLAAADAADVIAAHRAVAGKAFAGVRMIVSFDEAEPKLCWPQVTTADYLRGLVPSFNAGMSLLEKEGLSFDLHCNWHQLIEAASFLCGYPGLTVIINHMGCPFMGAEDKPEVLEVWRKGMKALAANPRVYMKASGFAPIRTSWLTDDAAFASCKGLLHEVIEAFGVDRVMFASNFPVDMFLTGGLGMEEHYAGFQRMVEDFSAEDKDKLFRSNARRVYKIDEL